MSKKVETKVQLPVPEDHPLAKFCFKTVPTSVEKSDAELAFRMCVLDALAKGSVRVKTIDLQKKRSLDPKTLIEDYHTGLKHIYESDSEIRDLIDKGGLRGIVVIAKNVTIPVASFDTYTWKIYKVGGKSDQYTMLVYYFIF